MTPIAKPLLLLACLALASCTTMHKYATGRYYEVYQAENLHACNYKAKFNACAEPYTFDVKISDDNNRLALANYVSQADSASYFGFIRDDYARQTAPFREFIAWSKAGMVGGKRLTVERKAGNAVGYLFEQSDVVYVFDFLHNRADEPMLVLNIAGRGRYFGFTPAEAERLLQVTDAWYHGDFHGKQLSGK